MSLQNSDKNIKLIKNQLAKILHVGEQLIRFISLMIKK